MSNINLNTGYGLVQASSVPSFTMGRTFYVVGATFANLNNSLDLYRADNEGVQRIFSGTGAVTNALAQCVASQGDIIMIDPSYSTVLTATELLAAETKGVSVIPVSKSLNTGAFFSDRATAVLPATTTGHLFTVTGRVRLLSIIGEVTTVIQTQACNLKLTLTPTVGSAVDICSVLNVSANAVGSQYTIDGILADALINSVGATPFQTGSLLLKAGYLDAITSATNTGSVKWKVTYQPVDAGAMMIAV